MSGRFSLSGRRVLVTGASRGLGAGIAQGMAEEGAEVILCARPSAELEAMTKSMTLDWAPHGIRVNTICPTFIETPQAEQTLASPECRAWNLSPIKLGRLGEIGDIMGPLVFLASGASALMTGTHLIVDGGWTAE